MIYKIDGIYKFYEYRVSYTQENSNYETPTNQKEIWEKFQDEGVISNVVFTTIHYSDEQKHRLSQVAHLDESQYTSVLNFALLGEVIPYSDVDAIKKNESIHDALDKITLALLGVG